MKNKILLLVSSFVFLFAFSLPVLVSAQTAKDAACDGVGLTSGGAGCAPAAGSPTVDSVIKTAITVLSVVVGVAAVIMIIIGGFKFITAGGEPAKIASARDTIMYSVVGLVVASLAQVIVQFVLGKV